MRRTLTAVIAGALLVTGCSTPEQPPAPPELPSPQVAVPLTPTGPATPDPRVVTTLNLVHPSGQQTPTRHTIKLGTVVDLTIASTADGQAAIKSLDLVADVTGGSGRIQFTALVPGDHVVIFGTRELAVLTVS
ncbi:hypothetical protein [Actinokineospora diospyrosa]|uniref:Uncharacterized protein n=1 Tax=Actinokineospora diospyrosa TaxID=103728 RepID=A0ABT1IC05_9PSEU|nr:hypothetical protein [Actinokineospora diospyrosa]MCP2270093.1 hypothetical protein [Actinokineospora diospyrosa]